MIDYAMADDFPTVNTDLRALVKEQWVDLQVDVSFNLPIEPGPVPILYRTFTDDTIYPPYTCPISLQIAWKLHQTLVRPRYKDIFDLIILLQNPEFDGNSRYYCLQSLVNECVVDKVNIKDLLDYISGRETERIEQEERKTPKRSEWNPPRLLSSILMEWEIDEFASDPSKVTRPASALLRQFQNALLHAGITEAVMQALPPPTRRSRSVKGA